MEAMIISQKKEFTQFHSVPYSLPDLGGSCRMTSEKIKTSLPSSLNNLPCETTKTVPSSDASQQTVPLEWISALVLVKFDIDQGNVIESIYPQNAFSKSEQKTISLLSFPDSNSFAAEGALKFIFKLKRDNTCPSNGFCSVFGYAYFNQQKDDTNPRGFSQKSFVILSALPLSGFFKSALNILASKYFSLGRDCDINQYLKDNYEVIMNEWPKPQSGIQYELSLNGTTLTLNMPRNLCKSKHLDVQKKMNEEKQPTDQRSFESIDSSGKESPNKESPIKEEVGSRTESDEDEAKEPTRTIGLIRKQSLSTILSGVNLEEKGCFQEINLYKIFKGAKLPYLWKVWELILTNQPVMVVSDLPSHCSEAVLGLLSIIYPLEYQTEYKPYFTIYDPEYKEIQELYDKKIAKCAVVGVTNPLFLKVMKSYPNILHLEKDYPKLQKKDASKKPSLLETTQKLYTLPDPNLKKILMPVESEESDAINNFLLRKSLQDLTQSFLSVFHIYFKLQINDIKKFEEKDFMKFLDLQKFSFKTHFSSQAQIIKLYSKFLKSPNFASFLKKFPNVYVVKSL